MGRMCATRIVSAVEDIEYESLLSAGARALLFDLDGTLCRRATKQLPMETRAFLEDLLHHGFSVGVLTNRRRNAKDPIVHSLRKLVPVICAARKPRRQGYRRLLDELQASPEDAVMIGDRWITDIWGAHRMGIDAIRVRRRKRK